MSSNQSRIERLQRQCNFAFHIYTDLAEATLEAMNTVKIVPIPCDLAAEVLARRIEEDIAQGTYLNARQMLMNALVG